MKSRISLLATPVVVAFWAAFCLFSCSSEENNNQDGNDLQDGTANDGTNGDTAGDRPGGDFPICDEVELAASPLANLLLVIDKSDSMNNPTSASQPDRTKVMDLRDAVHFLLDEFEGKIRFGWMAFPNQDNCDPGVVSVGVSDDSAGLIRSLVDAFTAWGATPTGESLQNAGDYEGLQDPERSNFVLLVTDGIPTCPNGNGNFNHPDDSALALSAVGSLHAAGIDTFVIGLGEDLNSSNPQLLTDMAQAGGTGDYHPASSLDDLKAAFAEIGKAVFDCSLALEVVPEKPEWIWVFFDDVPVSRNQQDGFDYDPVNNQIDFYGEACEKLRNGEVSRIDVEMGCAPPD